MTTDVVIGLHAQVLEKLPNGHYGATPVAQERCGLVFRCADRAAAVARLGEFLAGLDALRPEGADRAN